MSWGEMSCILYGDCKIANFNTCNTECKEYMKDDKYIPPPEPAPVMDSMPESNAGGPVLIRSPLKALDKKLEMVILHGKIYNVQSISPGKVILKLKKSLTKVNTEAKTDLIDGVFCWHQKGKIQPFDKILRENRIELKVKAEEAEEALRRR